MVSGSAAAMPSLTACLIRPKIACLRLEEDHWEGDTVVGKRAGKESVCFSQLQKKTETYFAFRIPGKTSETVMTLMNALHDEYGENFSQVFKTITVDNGSEFAYFAKAKNGGTKSSFLTRTLPGSILRTSSTTVYAGPTSPIELPLRTSPTKTSSPLLTS